MIVNRKCVQDKDPSTQAANHSDFHLVPQAHLQEHDDHSWKHKPSPNQVDMND
jgi:hypothetical protein